MGSFSSWSYTARCTVWEPTLDEFGQPSAFARSVFACSYKAGGNLALDDKAEQFAPRTTVWLEASEADKPKAGSFLVIGESLDASPPSDAQIIRVVMDHDPTLFDEGTPDRVLLTS